MTTRRHQHYHKHPAVSFENVTFTVPNKKYKTEEQIRKEKENRAKRIQKGKKQGHSSNFVKDDTATDDEPEKPMKQILKSVSFTVPRGRLVAVMGPSGSGKTTICDIIAGRTNVPSKGKISGEVKVLGKHVSIDGLKNGKGSSSLDDGHGDQMNDPSGSSKVKLVEPMSFGIGSDKKKRDKSDEVPASKIGYVHQDDLLLATFTPRETFRFSARLRLGAMEHNVREDIIDGLLAELKLDDASDTTIGDPAEGIKGVSGGERKRTAIGNELITMPDVLILDEPTSGLDAKTALELVTLLKRLVVEEGITVICSIHQPRTSIFELFDSLLLVHKGKLIYDGPTMEVINVLEDRGLELPAATNAADFLLDEIHDIDEALTRGKIRGVVIDSGESDDGYSDSTGDYGSSSSSSGSNDSEYDYSYDSDYEDEEAAGAVVRSRSVGGGGSRAGISWTEAARKSVAEGHKRNLFYQILITAHRAWLNHLRHPMSFMMTASTFLFLGVFTGAVYPRKLDNEEAKIIPDVNGALFFVAANAGFTTPFGVAAIFPKERALFTRERAAHYYSTLAYWVSTMIAFIPFQFVYTILIGATTYWITALSDDAEKFITFLVIVGVVIDAGTSIGYAGGAIARNVNAANSILSLLVLPMFTFGGLFVTDDAIPDYFIWLRYVSPFRYAFESLVINEFRDRIFYDCPSGSPDDIDITTCPIITGEEQIAKLTFSEDMLWWNVLIVFAISCGFRLVTYCFLHVKL